MQLNNQIKVAASILSADFGRLNEEIKSIENYADIVHVDVMDGHFVPNITIGAPVVRCIKTKLPMDVHLMIENPEKYIEDFVKALDEAGHLSDSTITIHFEACDDFEGILNKISELGVKVGVSIKPKTPVSKIEKYLHLIDYVLVMTVEPGFGGQSFMADMVPKIKELRAFGFDGDIGVDGGINADTAKVCIDAGANVMGAGSYIFNSSDRKAVIKSLRG